jgi:uncharacterized membrane protein HdeD (DUF308 family)
MLVLFQSPYASMSVPGDVEMSRRRRRSRTVSFVGLAMIVVGLVALVVPVDGLWRALVLPGSGLAAHGAFLGRSRYRRLLCGALALTLNGLVSAFLILAFYFDAPNPWWSFVGYAYPMGGIMSCVGAVLVIVESFRGPPVSADTAETA